MGRRSIENIQIRIRNRKARTKVFKQGKGQNTERAFTEYTTESDSAITESMNALGFVCKQEVKLCRLMCTFIGGGPLQVGRCNVAARCSMEG